ncbi:MAG TPA: ROK family protein [Gryllotalpicola sp.]
MSPAQHPHPLIAGVDIGGTTTQVVLCTPQLEVVARTRAATPAARGGDAMIATAAELIEHLLVEQGATLTGVGVGAAGVVDSAAGTVLVASDSFTDWAGYAVSEALTGRFGVPAFLENDVNAFLTGEVTAGAIAGERDALAMTLGTGVGGALWVAGELFQGAHGAAGEIGHTPGFGDLLCTCGRHGHLETIASGRSIAARYRERTGVEAGAAEIYERALAGDELAAQVFENAGAGVGQAITVVAALVDVTTVVIGGGVARGWRLLEPAIRRKLAAEPPVSGLPIRLELGALGEDAVAVGAASRVRRELGL